MSNWLRQIKTPSRNRNKYEFNNQTIVDRVKFEEAQKTIGKGKNSTFYKMHIITCGCGRKFKMNRTLSAILDHKQAAKLCPQCNNQPFNNHLYVSKREQEALKRMMEAKGCKVRKMTDEEKIKFKIS